jgi:amidohydrolase
MESHAVFDILANDPATAIRSATQAIEPALIAIRRDIHAHPELGFHEIRTAGVVSAELTRLGIPHQTGVGKTGVVGLIQGGRPGKTLAIRADMDALPIQETSGLGFASTVPGLMHACGHDIHTTTLLGVAAVLKQMAPHFAGAVKLVFQPAEEGLGGMQAMIDDGLMTDPAIDMGLGFHNYPDMPVGHFGFVRGPALAASDKFDIVVRGKSGHAAYPHTAIDPLVAAALLVAQLQTVVTREVPPTMPAVVTVGAIQGGTTYNIIPDSCLIKGTVRTLHRPARDLAQAAIERLAAGMLVGMRVHCEVTYQRGVPCLVNDDRILDQTVTAVRAQFGDDRITPFEATMGGEDFALMAERVPSFQLKIGSGQPGRADKLHNSAYQPDEACIGLGVQALSHAALQLLI